VLFRFVCGFGVGLGFGVGGSGFACLLLLCGVVYGGDGLLFVFGSFVVSLSCGLFGGFVFGGVGFVVLCGCWVRCVDVCGVPAFVHLGRIWRFGLDGPLIWGTVVF